jgi:hypothetical protein
LLDAVFDIFDQQIFLNGSEVFIDFTIFEALAEGQNLIVFFTFPIVDYLQVGQEIFD